MSNCIFEKIYKPAFVEENAIYNFVSGIFRIFVILYFTRITTSYIICDTIMFSSESNRLQQMTRWTQVLLVMYLFLRCSLSLEKGGEGVCNRTEIQTHMKTIQKEIVTGTTEIPCKVLSWLDQLSCMNRQVRTKNVTESIERTIQVSRPVTVEFCCQGYDLVSDQCVIQTTIPHITETTVPPVQETTNYHIIETTVPFIKETTVSTIKETSVPSIKETTIPPIKETTVRTTQIERATSTIEARDTTQPDIYITTHGEIDTTQKKIEPTTATQMKTDTLTAKERQSGLEVTSPAPEKTPDEYNVRDVLLYVSTSCAILLLISMVVVIWVCYRKSHNRKYRYERPVTLAMEDILANGNCAMGTDQNSIRTEMNQNAKNEYTELNLNDEPAYDQINGIAEEDPYEELPDYDDCEASPRLYKAEQSKNGLLFKPF